MKLYSRIKIAVIDDEPVFIHKCIEELRKIGFQKIEAFQSLKELSESSFGPDLLFCDIQFSSETALRQINNLPGKIPVIWVSAYPEYMVRAFGPRAIGFVDKADFEKKLHEVLQQALYYLGKIPTAEFQAYYEQISIPQNRIEMLLIEETRIYLRTLFDHKSIELTENNLKDCFSRLDPDLFFMASRSCIINLSGVVAVNEVLHEVTMHCGRTVLIPRRKWPDFKERYLWFF